MLQVFYYFVTFFFERSTLLFFSWFASWPACINYISSLVLLCHRPAALIVRVQLESSGEDWGKGRTEQERKNKGEERTRISSEIIPFDDPVLAVVGPFILSVTKPWAQRKHDYARGLTRLLHGPANHRLLLYSI